MANFGIKDIDNKFWKEIKRYALENDLSLKDLFLIAVKEKLQKDVKNE